MYDSDHAARPSELSEKDKQKIKDGAQQCFIERNRSTIAEKISDLISAGFTECEAHEHIIQVVKNLSSFLLPIIKAIPQEDADSDYRLTLANAELAKHSLGLTTHFMDED